MRAVRGCAALLAALALAVTLVAPAAIAGPQSNYFSAYDFRYEQPYSCGGLTCYAVPFTDGHASYFNAPGLTRTFLYDSIGGRTNSDGFVHQPGQNAGVMCWQASSSGAIWLLIDDRQAINGGTALFIGWVPDADITLTRADRLAYVPECGYTKTTAG